MHSFPLWVVKFAILEQWEDENPVFLNGARDELVEWDETTRRWRHLVLDHYRWIPAEELEIRPSDNEANAIISHNFTLLHRAQLVHPNVAHPPMRVGAMQSLAFGESPQQFIPLNHEPSAAPPDAAPVVRRNPPRAARAQKRTRSPDVAKESRKRRRGDDVPPVKTTVSRPSSGPRRKRTRRMAAEVHKMRCEAEDARRLVAETHETITLAAASVKNLVQDIDMISAHRPTPTLRQEASRNNAVIPTPNYIDGDASPQDLRLPQPAIPKPPSIKTGIAASRPTQTVGSTDTCGLYSATDSRALVKALSDRGNIGGCTCRPTLVQRRRIDKTKFLRPKVRIGIDAHGVPFRDWDERPLEEEDDDDDDDAGEIRWHKRESIVISKLYDHDRGYVLEPTLPVSRRPRRRRVFAKQFRTQSRHITPVVFDALEGWHVEMGRCENCLIRAMRSLPLWVVGVKSTHHEGFEDGSPVFVNAARDEMVEWDADIRGWRHLILDYYRWIPVEELEVRPSDSEANPNIVNGTRSVPLPLPACIFYDD
ncbi:hypothetical protein PUNSTDRAFT_146494 [Punctularia strigosozonata HHB-11173 SS5]|uniref:Uncharacterized protein n=1 Tax=Punctularia strigosozonata (strain HHB-11173) TaxID=741275 RepID=R7S3W9_PUNST|nr:uncharacterized protein PUNSTDRAFT_146494 [Punctularia strigosozonata HHB-11173 SS5]EIN04554.1 hypothetical protein PUNSTDRAFT_146494 [Punctularia strigosozonata HHB-11173 SS5]